VKFVIRFAVTLCLLIACFSARSGLLLSEPFNYPNGSLVNISTNGWSTHSGTAGDLQVVSGRAVLDDNDSEDVSASLAGQPYSGSSSNVLYASFTLNVTDLPSPSGEYFAHFKAGGLSNFRAKVFVLTSGAGGLGQYRIGISGASNSVMATNLTSLTTNTDYRVFIRYGMSNAAATLWVDPASEASPSVTATDATNGVTITSFALRQATSMGILSVDDLRVGTSFAEVFFGTITNPVVITQQPVNTSGIEGGAAVFTVAATGTAPLSYQWKFHGTNLPGATNTTLTLNNLTLAQAGPYYVTVSNAAGPTNSATATLTVFGASANGLLTVVHYNVKGNFTTNWSTNAPQVQAIARQLQYFDADIITLNEIPNGMRYEMTNWMTAFFPTYSLAISSNTDFAIRLGFISRYPIARSQSYLDSAGLTNFGYNGTFTRDLFEAEITVPGATEPLHIFTTHLKSGPDPDSQQRRAAECSAVSNFFATVFTPTNGSRPYLLTGDLNEDINLPMSQNLQAIQRLTNNTGLKLTTPLNPFTLTRFTHSIQGALDARFDYVMPAGVLASNLVTSQVFRTDLLNPVPPGLNSNDCIVASDHLPVVMVFRYPDPPLLTTLTLSNANAVLSWPTLVGRSFKVEQSTALGNWTVAASNVSATATMQTWTTPVNSSSTFFRVLRQP